MATRNSRNRAGEQGERRRKARILMVSLLLTFGLTRAVLHHFPDTDLNVGSYNIHHLFTGLLVITVCGIPLSLFAPPRPLGDGLLAGFGVGLALALDEWVYLIATDGSNASYLTPVSFWGGLFMIAAACLYIAILCRSIAPGFTGARASRIGQEGGSNQ